MNRYRRDLRFTATGSPDAGKLDRLLTIDI